MWSTYSLYDPSYQNHESFGFFIDFGNGLSTIPPSILMNFAMVLSNTSSAFLSPLFVGCVGLAMYWQVMYGTIIYVLSFVYNRRYEGKSLLEVFLFVGISNSLWLFFPIAGIYSCVCMLRDSNMNVFQ
jgi:TRAP-type C4-dicarboxylate transport system permease large subunit